MEARLLQEIGKRRDSECKRTLKVGWHTELQIGGPREEWVNLMESTLNEIFNEADRQTNRSGNVEEIRQCVEELLDLIKQQKDVIYTGSERKCILLHFECLSYEGVRCLLQFFHSESYQIQLNKIVNTLKQHFRLYETVYITSTIPQDVLMTVAFELGFGCLENTAQDIRTNCIPITDSRHSNRKFENAVVTKKHQKGIRLAGECTSADGVLKVCKLFQRGGATTSLQKLQEVLSRHAGQHVELTASLDVAELLAAVTREDVTDEQKEGGTLQKSCISTPSFSHDDEDPKEIPSRQLPTTDETNSLSQIKEATDVDYKKYEKKTHRENKEQFQDVMVNKAAELGTLTLDLAKQSRFEGRTASGISHLNIPEQSASRGLETKDSWLFLKDICRLMGCKRREEDQMTE